MIASFAASIALITTLLLAPAEAQQPPEDPKALAEFLMEMNAESMNALGSISYEFTETYEQFSPKRPSYHDERRGSYRRNWYGEFMECMWGARESMIDGKEIGTFERTDRYVVNLEYLCHWTVDSITPAMIFHRDGTGGFSKRAETELGMSGSERQHLFAFGTGERGLQEELLKLSTRTQYTAAARRLADENKRNLFELEWGYLIPQNNGRAVLVHRFILDGDRGYLVTHGEQIYRPGINLLEWDVELDRLDSVWYPKAISYRRWSPNKHPATQPADMKLFSRFKTTINEMKVDQKFDDAQFQFVALGMPDGNVVCTEEKDEHGGFVSFYVQGAELIPAAQAEGTELHNTHQELFMRRIEEQKIRKQKVPASQPSR
jgi:hypothetical protein